MPVDGVGGGGIWSLDARLGEDHALSKAAASHMHTPSTNICSRTLFTNTQICEHERQSQTLLHTHAWQSFLTMLNFALLNMPGALLRKRGELECPDF